MQPVKLPTSLTYPTPAFYLDRRAGHATPASGQGPRGLRASADDAQAAPSAGVGDPGGGRDDASGGARDDPRDGRVQVGRRPSGH